VQSAAKTPPPNGRRFSRFLPKSEVSNWFEARRRRLGVPTTRPMAAVTRMGAEMLKSPAANNISQAMRELALS
jgi:hypothetical protein